MAAARIVRHRTTPTTAPQTTTTTTAPEATITKAPDGRLHQLSGTLHGYRGSPNPPFRYQTAVTLEPANGARSICLGSTPSEIAIETHPLTGTMLEYALIWLSKTGQLTTSGSLTESLCCLPSAVTIVTLFIWTSLMTPVPPINKRPTDTAKCPYLSILSTV